VAEHIELERRRHGDYRDIEDLVRRIPEITLPQLEAMATGGLFGECFGMERREALWAAGAAARSRVDRLPGLESATVAPTLPGMEPIEVAVADLWATGVAPTGHPTQFLRERLDEMGVVTAERLATIDATKVWVAGVVTHRQRPATAQGTTFMNLEDETGLINIVVSVGCWKRFRPVARGAAALLVRGRLERVEGVVNIVAEHMTPLTVAPGMSSRNFR
jgi:error-prone DNA polymerase